MRSHVISGGGDVDLHVAEKSDREATPILFVHGYSQCHLSWRKQFESSLAEEFRLVAPDMRGHGRSDKPIDGYDDSERWAEDVRGVVEALELNDVVLVGWSYAGLVVCDYLATYGTDRVAGVQFVDAISKIGTEAATALLDEGYVDLLPGLGSTDAVESIDALGAFVDRCVYERLPPEEFYFVLGFNAVVPPYVRERLRDRTVVHDDLLGDLDVPVMITHGEEDRIVRSEAAKTIAEFASTDRTSFYPDTGHAPFWEQPERFNGELHDFVTDCVP